MSNEYVQPKIPIAEIRRYALECLNDDEIVSFIRSNIPNESDDYGTRMQVYSERYTDKKGIDLRYQHGYRVGLNIADHILRGVYKDVYDKQIYESFGRHPAIDWSDD